MRKCKEKLPIDTIRFLALLIEFANQLNRLLGNEQFFKIGIKNFHKPTWRESIS